MGNRAIITTQKDFDNNGIGVYLHWNGGRDSVQAFLTALPFGIYQFSVGSTNKVSFGAN